MGLSWKMSVESVIKFKERKRAGVQKGSCTGREFTLLSENIAAQCTTKIYPQLQLSNSASKLDSFLYIYTAIHMF